MCGIAGAWNVPDASKIVAQMLKALQHRGQDAAGIMSAAGGRLHEVRGLGLVDEVFYETDFAAELPGVAAIGHIRYTTSGSADDRESIQPMHAALRKGEMALCHNGNLTNFAELRDSLMASGAIFRSKSDTEVFFHLITRSKQEDAADRLRDATGKIKGAWTILALYATPEPRLIAAVDPLGFRPLCFANYNGGTVFASETCALDLLGIPAKDVVHVQPGMLVDLTAERSSVGQIGWATKRRHCSFENVYFSRPDSSPVGLESNLVRLRLGRALAEEDFWGGTAMTADIVTAVPDSSNAIALAYAEAIGLPFRFALIRNHYTGRNFITPKQPAREFGIRMKLNAVRSEVAGKRIIVVDDSLVRGTTAAKVVTLLREAGATEVHLRIGSPPVIHPCQWGIDTPTLGELSAATTPSPAGLAKKLGADSLRYLSLKGLRAAVGDKDGGRYCVTCFTGKLPDEGVTIHPDSLVRH